MTRKILCVVILFAVEYAHASCIGGEDTNVMKIHYATPAEAEVLLCAEDDFIKNITPLDIEMILGHDSGNGVENTYT